MINHVVKDLILKYLIEVSQNYSEESFQLNYIEIGNMIGVKPIEVQLILDQFINIGLIRGEDFEEGMLIWMKADAYDLYNRGGFTATEELLKKNIEKLLLEIESLKPSAPDKVERITSIAAHISTALGLFTSAFIKGS